MSKFYLYKMQLKQSQKFWKSDAHDLFLRESSFILKSVAICKRSNSIKVMLNGDGMIICHGKKFIAAQDPAC